MKSVQIWSFFWSVFSHIRTEGGDLRRKCPYSVQMRENADKKKLRIWWFCNLLFKIMTFLILLIENCGGLGPFFQNFRAYQISYIAIVRKLMLIHYMNLFSREKYTFQGIRNDEISQCEVSPPNFATNVKRI